MKKYDVVVIGAGNGGLAAAARIAKSGKSVLVVEKHNLPGGCATSYRRGDFEFEASLHQLCQMGEGGDLRKLVDEFGLRVDWVSVNEAYRVIFLDDFEPVDITLPVGIPDYIDAIEKKVPGSRLSLVKMFEMAKKIKAGIEWLAAHDNNPKGFDKIAFALKFGDVLGMISCPTDEMLKRLKMPETARHIVEQYWDYLGVDSTKMSFGVYVFMLYIYLTQKPWITAHRSYELSLSFDEAIRKNGGDIWYNTPCVHINVSEGKVQGITIVDGSYIPTDYVICNVMPEVVFGSLVDRFEVPLRDRKAMNARKLGLSCATVNLGLNMSYEDLRFKGYDVFVRKYGDTLRQYDESSELDNHDISITCLNAVLPDCTKKGQSILQFALFFKDNPFENVNEKDYFAVKDQIAEMCVARFEELSGISIRNSIAEIDITTPVTWARYLGTPGGTVYGYTPLSWDGMFARQQSVKELDYTIEGLRFCGGHGAYMDGYSQAILSGNQAALFILEEMEEKSHAKV